VTFPTQIGTLYHCRASNWSLTMGLSSSDVSVLQADPNLPPAQFCYYTARLYPSSYSPSAMTRLLGMVRSLRTLFRSFYNCWRFSSTLLWCAASSLMNLSARQVPLCMQPHSHVSSSVSELWCLAGCCKELRARCQGRLSCVSAVATIACSEDRRQHGGEHWGH